MTVIYAEGDLSLCERSPSANLFVIWRFLFCDYNRHSPYSLYGIYYGYESGNQRKLFIASITVSASSAVMQGLMGIDSSCSARRSVTGSESDDMAG